MIDPLCAALASGSVAAIPRGAQFEELWERARASRVDVLLAALVRRSPGRMPGAVRTRIEARLHEAVALEMSRARELGRLVERFHAAAIDVLLLKGAALAYTIYPEPYLRPADDIDLFIRREALERAEHTLRGCGYQRANEPDSELASGQRHYVRSGGGPMWIDLHWRIANPQLFADAIDFDAAWASAVPVPALESSARALSTADALLLACVHRVAHHQDDQPHLLWVWDIHLLVESLTTADEGALVDKATRTGMCAVTARGLELARELFGTPVPERVLERLRTVGSGERAARFLGGGVRPIDVLSADLGAMRTWEQRFRLVGEHLFPQPSYMRARYAGWPGVLLPLAYLDRIVRGAPKWFRRPAEATSRPSR